MLKFIKKTVVLTVSAALLLTAVACKNSKDDSLSRMSTGTSTESATVTSSETPESPSQPDTVSKPIVQSSSVIESSIPSQAVTESQETPVTGSSSSSSSFYENEAKEEYVIPDSIAIPDPDSNYVQRRTTEYYYKSDTSEIDIKQYKTDGGQYYWLAHIKITFPDQIFGGLANNKYGAQRQTTSAAAKANSWLLAINGSYFDYSTNKPKYVTSAGAEFYNPMIKNGVLIDNADGITTANLICIKYDGTIFTPESGLTGNELLNMGVKDCFMTYDPLMISDGIKCRTDVIKEGHPVGDKNYPRTAIGMVKPCEYYIIVAGDYTEESGVSFVKMQDIFYNLGCTYARSLDGGGSSTFTFNGKLINVPEYGNERQVVDFVCFTD